MPRRRRPISEDTQRDLLARQGALTALTQHPSWPELHAEVERKRQRIEKLVLTKTLAVAAPVDSHEMAYLRGFIHGMNWFVQVPETAETSLERFLKAQGVTTEGAPSE